MVIAVGDYIAAWAETVQGRKLVIGTVEKVAGDYLVIGLRLRLWKTARIQRANVIIGCPIDTPAQMRAVA